MRLDLDWSSLPRRSLMAFVRGYRLVLSPWLGNSCRFEPTCSVYALEALSRHGAAVGSALTLHRIARCHPWCAGGHDPVPEQLPRTLPHRRRQRPVAAPSTSNTASDRSHP